MKYRFSPSLMCMDLGKFAEQVQFLNQHAYSYHVDIMDGHYVENITLSPFFIEQLRKLATIPIDVHLMCTHPEPFIRASLDAGANCISVHPETVANSLFRIADEVHERGQQFGVVLNPELPVSSIKEYVHVLDKVTIMSVDPGFAGQRFIPETLNKVAQLTLLREQSNVPFLIEIDGSCNDKTFRQIHDAGVDIFIIGASGLFNRHEDVSQAWQLMEQQFAKQLQAEPVS